MLKEFSDFCTNNAKNANALIAAGLIFFLGLLFGAAGAFSTLQREYDDRLATIKEFQQQKAEADYQKQATVDVHKTKPAVEAKKTAEQTAPAKVSVIQLSKPVVQLPKDSITSPVIIEGQPTKLVAPQPAKIVEQPVKVVEVELSPPATVQPAVAAPVVATPVVRSSGRRLSENQKANLTSQLTSISHDLNRVVIYAGAPANTESQEYLADIVSAVQASNINVQFGSQATFDSAHPEANRGLYLGVKDKDSPPQEARILANAMNKAGLNVSFATMKGDVADRYIEVITGYN